MNDEQFKELVTSLENLACNTLRIAHGDVDGPAGLEGLAVAIAGNRLEEPLSRAVSEGLSEIAQSIERGLESIAEAITGVASAKEKVLPTLN